MENSSPVPTPIVRGLQLDAQSAGSLLINSQRDRYQQAVGCLLYLALGTRPDIAFAVGMLSRFTSCPRTRHAQALNRVLRYLNGTRHAGIRYKAGKVNEKPALFGYSDADHGGTIHKEGRRSTGGYIFLLTDRPISWQSKRQTVVSTSTLEAEYIGQYNAAREVVWIRLFLEELGLRDLIANLLNIVADNNGANKLSKDPAYHSRAKHIDVKYHWQCQEIERKTIKITYVPSHLNGADGLTKPSDPGPFYTFKSLIRLYDINESADNGGPMDLDS
jgi:hypothetical protein